MGVLARQGRTKAERVGGDPNWPNTLRMLTNQLRQTRCPTQGPRDPGSDNADLNPSDADLHNSGSPRRDMVTASSKKSDVSPPKQAPLGSQSLFTYSQHIA